MDCFVASLLAMTTVDTFNVCNDSTITPRRGPATGLDRTPVRLQAVPDRDVPHTGDRSPDGVPHLPAIGKRGVFVGFENFSYL
jgi:hypothetical protein